MGFLIAVIGCCMIGSYTDFYIGVGLVIICFGLKLDG